MNGSRRPKSPSALGRLCGGQQKLSNANRYKNSAGNMNIGDRSAPYTDRLPNEPLVNVTHLPTIIRCKGPLSSYCSITSPSCLHFLAPVSLKHPKILLNTSIFFFHLKEFAFYSQFWYQSTGKSLNTRKRKCQETGEGCCLCFIRAQDKESHLTFLIIMNCMKSESQPQRLKHDIFGLAVPGSTKTKIRKKDSASLWWFFYCIRLQNTLN